MHLVLLVANLGRFAHLGIVVARHASTVIATVDHHVPPAERVRLITSRVPIDADTTVEVMLFRDVAFDCVSTHPWQLVDLVGAALTIAAHCPDCGATEQVPPFPAPAERRQAPRLFAIAG